MTLVFAAAGVAGVALVVGAVGCYLKRSRARASSAAAAAGAAAAGGSVFIVQSAGSANGMGSMYSVASVY